MRRYIDEQGDARHWSCPALTQPRTFVKVSPSLLSTCPQPRLIPGQAGAAGHRTASTAKPATQSLPIEEAPAWVMDVNRASRDEWLQLPGCNQDMADLSRGTRGRSICLR